MNGGSAAMMPRALRLGEPVVHAGRQPQREAERVRPGLLGRERFVQGGDAGDLNADIENLSIV